jgi:hypothetical protein
MFLSLSEQGLSGKDGETGAAGPNGPAVSVQPLTDVVKDNIQQTVLEE